MFFIQSLEEVPAGIAFHSHSDVKSSVEGKGSYQDYQPRDRLPSPLDIPRR